MKKLIYLLASAILAGLLIGCTPTVSSCCMHSATDTSITKEATCTETGVKTTKCLECGEVLKTEPVPTKDHEYDEWYNDYTTLATVCSSCPKTQNEWRVEGTTLHILKDISTLGSGHHITLDNNCVKSITVDYSENNDSFEIDSDFIDDIGFFRCGKYAIMVYGVFESSKVLVGLDICFN